MLGPYVEGLSSYVVKSFEDIAVCPTIKYIILYIEKYKQKQEAMEYNMLTYYST